MGRDHPERPERLQNLLQALRTKWVYESGDKLQVYEPKADVTDEQLLRVHTRAHLAKTEFALTTAAAGLGVLKVNLDADTIASPGTWAAARRAAGLVVAAVDDTDGAPCAAPGVCDGAAAGPPRGGGPGDGLLLLQQRAGGRGARAGGARAYTPYRCLYPSHVGAYTPPM